VEIDDVMQEYVLGRLDSAVLPDVATRLLMAGVDTEEMAQAAMPDTADPRDVRALFEAALVSAAISWPSWEQAAVSWIGRQAQRAASGELTLDEVARSICETFGWPNADLLPAPYLDVVIAAGEDIEPWWREAFADSLAALPRKQ
jgi:hypothetical protein